MGGWDEASTEIAGEIIPPPERLLADVLDESQLVELDAFHIGIPLAIDDAIQDRVDGLVSVDFSELGGSVRNPEPINQTSWHRVPYGIFMDRELFYLSNRSRFESKASELEFCSLSRDEDGFRVIYSN